MTGFINTPWCGVMADRVPHTLYLPMRFLRIRRPG